MIYCFHRVVNTTKQDENYIIVNIMSNPFHVLGVNCQFNALKYFNINDTYIVFICTRNKFDF